MPQPKRQPIIMPSEVKPKPPTNIATKGRRVSDADLARMRKHTIGVQQARANLDQIVKQADEAIRAAQDTEAKARGKQELVIEEIVEQYGLTQEDSFNPETGEIVRGAQQSAPMETKAEPEVEAPPKVTPEVAVGKKED